MQKISFDQLINDPWNAAKSIVEGVQSSTEFVIANNYASSVVLSQDFENGDMTGRFCTF